MRFRLMIGLLFGIISNVVFSQEVNEDPALLQNGYEWLYSHPEQSQKIGEHILKNSSQIENICEAYLLLSKSHFITGNYKEALEYVNHALENISETDNDILALHIILFASEIYRVLNLDELADRQIASAKVFSLGNNDTQKIYEKYLLLVNSVNHPSDVLKAINSSESTHPPYAILSKGTVFTQIAEIYLKKQQPDSAKIYFDIAIEELADTPGSDYWDMKAQISYSNYFFLKKEYSQAIQALEKPKIITIGFKMPLLPMKFIINYLPITLPQTIKQNTKKILKKPPLLNLKKKLKILML